MLFESFLDHNSFTFISLSGLRGCLGLQSEPSVDEEGFNPMLSPIGDVVTRSLDFTKSDITAQSEKENVANEQPHNASKKQPLLRKSSGEYRRGLFLFRLHTTLSDPILHTTIN